MMVGALMVGNNIHPVVFVVRGVREKVLYVQRAVDGFGRTAAENLARPNDRGDEPVVVASHVEDQTLPHLIRRGIGLTNIGEAGPDSFLCNLKPRVDPISRIRVTLAGTQQALPRDHIHRLLMYFSF